MREKLGQSDVEDLSAFLDGLLDADRAAQVEDLIRNDPAWQAEWNQLQALDSVLDVYDVPAPPDDLAGRIVEFVRARTWHRKVLRWVWPVAGAAAAAAIIIIAMTVGTTGPETVSPEPKTVVDRPGPDPVSPAPRTLVKKPTSAEVEQAIVEHFDFVRDMDVLENYETLKAIERIELASRGS